MCHLVNSNLCQTPVGLLRFHPALIIWPSMVNVLALTRSMMKFPDWKSRGQMIIFPLSSLGFIICTGFSPLRSRLLYSSTSTFSLALKELRWVWEKGPNSSDSLSLAAAGKTDSTTISCPTTPTGATGFGLWEKRTGGGIFGLNIFLAVFFFGEKSQS